MADLVPCDFPVLKSRLAGIKFNDDEEMKWAVMAEITRMWGAAWTMSSTSGRYLGVTTSRNELKNCQK